MPKPDKLFVTEAECAERIGVSTEDFKAIAIVAEKSGMPMKDPLFKGRRYWPAVSAWLDLRYGLSSGSITVPPGLDGEENWPT